MEKEWEQLGEITGNFGISATVIDDENNIYVEGFVTDTVKIGEQYFTAKQSCFKSVVMKFDPQGNILWATDTINKENYNHGYITKIAIDTKGNLYIAANRHNNYESFLSKINPYGKMEWQVRANYYNGYSQHYSYFFEDIAVDENDNVYFAGQGYITTFSSKDDKTYTLDARFFVGSYDSEGKMRFLRAAGGAGSDSRCRSIAILEDNLFVLARYEGTIRFKSNTFHKMGGSRDTNFNAWFAKYSKYDLRMVLNMEQENDKEQANDIEQIDNKKQKTKKSKTKKTKL